MAEQLPVQELDQPRLATNPATIQRPAQTQEEPPSWKEIKDSDEYKGLDYSTQLELAQKWGEETKAYASTLPDFTEEQARQIDDFVAKEAVDVPAEIKSASLVAGAVKGTAGALGALAGGAGGALIGGPIGGVVGAVGGGIAGGQIAESAMERFTPKVSQARQFAPTQAAVGEYAPSVLMGAAGLGQLAKTGTTIFKELGAKKAAEELAKYGGTAGLVGGGVGTATRAILGEKITPATIAQDTLFGIAFSGLGANSRVKGYTKEQALSLNERVKANQATPEEFRDWNSILAEAKAKQATGVESAKITEATLGGKQVVGKTELTTRPAQPEPEITPLPAGELQAPKPIVPEIAEAGVRGSERGTQADTGEMQRRGITSEMQRSLIDLDDPVPRTNVFTTESQGIRKDAIIPMETVFAGGKPYIEGELGARLVREGPLVTPRTQLEYRRQDGGEQPPELLPSQPTTEQLALPARREMERELQVEAKVEGEQPQPAQPQPAQPIQPTTTIPRPMGGQGEAGAITLDPVVKGREFVQKWATTEGNLPKEAFDILEARDQRVQAMRKQIEFTLRDLTQATRAINKSKELTKDQSSIIDSYMRGESDVVNQLPEAMRAPVVQMRRQIDNLSDRLIESGVFKGEKAQVVEARKGEYLTRSYEKYDNPNFSYEFLQKRDPERFENAIKFLQDEIMAANPALSVAEARTLAEGKARTISNREDGFSLDSLVKAFNLRKDLGITKSKRSIDEQVRYLLGEYEDPIINYAKTAVKMINLLQSQKTLTEIRNWGLQNKLFFDKPTGKAAKMIAPEGAKTMEPLNGLYAEPELVDALLDFDQSIKSDGIFKMFSMMNAYVKWGKTVGSIQAQFRNPISNVLIEIGNGNFFFTGGGKSMQTIFAEFGVPQANQKEMRQYITRATQLGILDTTVLNEFYQTLKDAQNYKGTAIDYAEKLAGKGLGIAGRGVGKGLSATERGLGAVGRGAKVGIDFLNKTYRAGDNFFKLMAWENETKMLMDGRKMPREEAEVIAAERVKNTRPTYSRVFRGIKRWRNQPLFGNFMSWPSEMLRTLVNTVRYAVEDARTPGMRKYGYKRLIGALIRSSAIFGLARAFQWATGFNDNKMNAVKRFVAPYQKNAVLSPTGVNADGSIGYIDLSYTDPNDVFLKPILAASQGRDVEGRLFDSGRQFLESYLGPSILANSIMSVIVGTTPEGRKITNPQDSELDKLADRLNYLVRQNEPGTVSQLRRIYYALTGIPDTAVSKYGRTYQPAEEMIAILGVRPQSINLAKALEYKGARFNSNIADVGRIFTETYGAVGTMKQSDIQDQYAKMENRRRILFDEANKDFHAAMLLGMTRGEAISSLRAGGMGTANAIAVANNRYPDYKISRALTKQMRKELTPEEMAKRQDIARELQMGAGE